MKKPRKREHSITMQTLSKRLAAYHAAVLEAHLGVLDCLRNSDIKTQGMIRDLTLRIDRALTELHEEAGFVDKLTAKLPASPSGGHGMVFEGVAASPLHTHVYVGGACSCGQTVTYIPNLPC